MGPNWPIFKAFSALRAAKIAQHGLTMGSFHLFVHPNFRAFCDFGVAKMACNGLKKGSLHLFGNPK